MDEKTAIKKKFDQAKQNIVIDLISEGKTFAEACQKVGISRTTEWETRKSDPLYSKQIDRAKELQFEAVEGVLYSECIAGNITAIIYYLKCNRPRKYNPATTTVTERTERRQVTEIEMV